MVEFRLLRPLEVLADGSPLSLGGARLYSDDWDELGEFETIVPN